MGELETRKKYINIHFQLKMLQGCLKNKLKYNYKADR